MGSIGESGTARFQRTIGHGQIPPAKLEKLPKTTKAIIPSWMMARKVSDSSNRLPSPSSEIPDAKWGNSHDHTKYLRKDYQRGESWV
jgi:hypothetical protein